MTKFFGKSPHAAHSAFLCASAARDANLISANPICLQRTMRRPEAETIPTDTRIPNEKLLGLVLNVKISHNAINLYHGECHVLQSGKKIGPSSLLRQGPAHSCDAVG